MSPLGYDGYLAHMRALNEDADQKMRAYDAARRRSTARQRRRFRHDRESMTVAEKREYLATVIRYVFVKPPTRRRSQEPVSPDRVHIVWFDDPEVDIPRQGRRDWTPAPFIFSDDANDPRDSGVAVA